MNGDERVLTPYQGHRWHRDRDCAYLDNSGRLKPATVAEAEDDGYTRCQHCGYIAPVL